MNQNDLVLSKWVKISNYILFGFYVLMLGYGIFLLSSINENTHWGAAFVDAILGVLFLINGFVCTLLLLILLICQWVYVKSAHPLESRAKTLHIFQRVVMGIVFVTVLVWLIITIRNPNAIVPLVSMIPSSLSIFIFICSSKYPLIEKELYNDIDI